MTSPAPQRRAPTVAIKRNYADDLVICCRPGSAPQAMAEFRELMTRLGLTVNDDKTQRVKLPEESFDFLGYTIGRFNGRDGRPYVGTRPSKKSLRKLLRRIHDETSSHWNWQTADEKVLTLIGWLDLRRRRRGDRC